jgi:hypothetical protein
MAIWYIFWLFGILFPVLVCFCKKSGNPATYIQFGRFFHKLVWSPWLCSQQCVSKFAFGFEAKEHLFPSLECSPFIHCYRNIRSNLKRFRCWAPLKASDVHGFTRRRFGRFLCLLFNFDWNFFWPKNFFSFLFAPDNFVQLQRRNKFDLWLLE